MIKIERPEGDFARGYDSLVKGESAYFVWLNRGKESIVLDLKQAGDAALLARMVARADVFIQNLAPGAAARLGFDSGELRSRHPRLITCDLSGYGESGPYRDMKAYDLLVQAESGLASITGGPEGPGRVGVSVCDIAAGLNAYSAILEALIRRGRSGEGSAVKVSLFDGMADWMTVPLLHHDYGGQAPQRVGLNHPTIAPYGVYRLADGEVLLSIQNEREWHRLCAEVLENPALATESRFASNGARVANRAALDREIAAVFGKLTRQAAVARLNRAAIAFGMLNGVEDLSVHPQLRRVTIQTPSGPVRLPAPAARTADDGTTLGPVPALGEHSEKLRREFAP